MGLSNDPADYNGGHGVGNENFAKLLNEAWDAAVAHAKTLAKNSKCGCKEITVVFQGWKDGKLADDAVPGMSRNKVVVPVEE